MYLTTKRSNIYIKKSSSFTAQTNALLSTLKMPILVRKLKHWVPTLSISLARINNELKIRCNFAQLNWNRKQVIKCWSRERLTISRRELWPDDPNSRSESSLAEASWYANLPYPCCRWWYQLGTAASVRRRAGFQSVDLSAAREDDMHTTSAAWAEFHRSKPVTEWVW